MTLNKLYVIASRFLAVGCLPSAQSPNWRGDCFGAVDEDGECGWVHPTTAIATTPRNDACNMWLTRTEVFPKMQKRKEKNSSLCAQILLILTP